MMRVGINGFGRIGRYFLRTALQRGQFEVAMVNDLSDVHTLAHLFKYDSVHGRLPFTFQVEGNAFVLEDGRRIVFTQEADPAKIDWKMAGVELVIESTGFFRKKELAEKHLHGTVKRVIISAPAKGDLKTIVLGVNDEKLTAEDVVFSNASCTTNNVAPMIKVLRELGKIESAYIATVHSYTSDQRLQDAPHSDLRRARAAALNIVPTTTGAAEAVIKIYPDLEGKMKGYGIRVPTPNGSMTDCTVVLDKEVSKEEVNAAMKLASETYLKGILRYTDEPLVSMDIIGEPTSCVFDSLLTEVIGKSVKIVGWYDNEAGYSNRLVDLIEKLK